METSTERLRAARGAAWGIENEAPQAPAWRDFARRLLASRSAVVGLASVLLLCLVALLAPVLALHPYAEQDLLRALDPPLTPGYPLGTDAFGRDLYSRIV